MTDLAAGLLPPSVAFLSATTAMPDPPPLLLLSFDGFRHDYIDRHPAPNLRWLRAAGSSAGAVRQHLGDAAPHWS